MVLIFIHGTNNDATIWKEQEERFRDLGHATISVTLPAHGNNEGMFTWNESLETIDSIVNNYGDKEIILVGISLGGYLATEYAANHPHKIAGVVALSCATNTRMKLLKHVGSAVLWVSKKHHLFKIRARSWKITGEMLQEVSNVSIANNLLTLKHAHVPALMVSGTFDFLRVGESRMKQLPESYCVIPGTHNFLSNKRAANAFTSLLSNFLRVLTNN